jgi:hypothetical protein
LTVFLQPSAPAWRMLVVPMRTRTGCLSLVLALFGCSPDSPPEPPPAVHVEIDTPASAEPKPPQPIDPRFAETLHHAAAKYRQWGRVDERPNLAPMLCRAPSGIDYGFPSHARLSGADDAQHGRKLYYLFAGLGEHGMGEHYGRLGTPAAQEIPVGFTIVKQSWTAVPSPRPVANEPVPIDESFRLSSNAPAPINWVVHDGQRLEVGEQAELFVLTKVGPPDMPGTDAGWIYATLSADGTRITSSGLVEQCMGCHEAATHERLFGLQKTKAFASIKPSRWDTGEDPTLPASLGLEP